MNEPTVTVGLIYFAVLLTVPLALAVIIAVCARWGRPAIWTAWAALYLPIAAIAWPMSDPLRTNQSDEWLFFKIIFGGGIATAAAALVVDRRKHKQPSVATWQLAALAMMTVVGLSIVLVVI